MASEFANLRVLVVDDDRFTRQLVRRLLEVLGVVHVQECSDGSQALECLHHGVDLVITDYAMAPMDGLTFCRAVRAAERGVDRRVPIIMMTAHSDVHTVKAARDAGVTELLAKPISVKAVTTRLEAALQRPREFVVTNAYVGPDRRRRRAEVPPEMDRRGEGLDGSGA